MTIQRIYQSGFELNSLTEIDSEAGNNVISTSAAYTGTYGIRSTKGTGTDYFNIFIPSTYQARIGFFTKTDTDNSSSEHLGLYKDTTKVLHSRWEGFTAGYMAILRSNTYLDTGNPLTIAWYHIGFDFKIDASVGWFYAYVNGVQVLSYDGNTTSNPINLVRLGNLLDVGTVGRVVDYDDIYIDDTTGESAPDAPPMLMFNYLTPNNVGNYSQWTPTSGSNFENVDEKPPNEDTDYVEIDVEDKKDSYNMDTFTLESGQEIKAVIPISRIKRTGSTEQVQLGTRLSSTDLLGSDQDPGASYGYLWERQTTKPGGGGWGQSDIDDVEFLINSSGSY